jgi:hypothetical protein
VSDLCRDIEVFLLEQPGWVSAKVLAAHFGLQERALRGVGLKPGLCAGFAVSGDKGYRHVSKATTAEFLRFSKRLCDHARGELRRVRVLRNARNASQLRELFQND